MSTKTKAQTAQAVQLEPQVSLCETDPHSFLLKLEAFILQGYRLDLQQMVTLIPGCCIASVALPEAVTA